MRKAFLVMVFIFFFSQLSLAGFYLQAEFMANPASREETQKNGEEKKPVEPVILDIWLNGTSLKLHPGKEEIPWLIWEGKKEWFAVGFLLESEKGKKPEKVALTGTVDEVLKIIEDFLTPLKELMAFAQKMPNEEDKKTPSQEESRKVKVKVRTLSGERNIAGCVTRGIVVEVLEDEKQKEEVEIWFCPEVSFEALQKPLISVQEKLKKFAQKWEKEFSSLDMHPKQEVSDTLTVEWRSVMENIQGFPFEVTGREEKGNDSESITVYRVKKYLKEEFPASFFTVPEDYRSMSFAELLERYLPNLPMGNLPVPPKTEH